MVLPGERDYTVTGPERSKTLHNFTLPYLKWGNQRHLRCMKVGSASGGGGAGVDDHRFRRRSSPLKFEYSWETISAGFADADHRSNNQPKRLRTATTRLAENGGEEGIDEFREKIMSDLRTVADKMKESIFKKEALGDKDKEDHSNGGDQEKERRRANQKQKEKEKHKETEVSPPPPPPLPEEVKPWNLRTRRAACKAPIAGADNYNGNQNNSVGNQNNKGLRIEGRRADSSPLRNDSAKSLRTRDSGGAAAGETKERRKFSLSLTRNEIEDDFMELLGHRPPRRPKKRPRTVQKQLDFLFPGLYLTEVSPDLYKVPESAENGKR